MLQMYWGHALWCVTCPYLYVRVWGVTESDEERKSREMDLGLGSESGERESRGWGGLVSVGVVEVLFSIYMRGPQVGGERERERVQGGS